MIKLGTKVKQPISSVCPKGGTGTVTFIDPDKGILEITWNSHPDLTHIIYAGQMETIQEAWDRAVKSWGFEIVEDIAAQKPPGLSVPRLQNWFKQVDKYIK